MLVIPHSITNYNYYIIVHRQRACFRREQVDILDDFCTKQSYYPTMEQYQELVDQAGLTRKQIIVGFRSSLKIISIFKLINFHITSLVLNTFQYIFKNANN